jgi:transcriptional regulator with XRE-family HTH domain
MKEIRVNPNPIIHRFPRQSQEAIAEAVGLSRHTVSAWLRGDVARADLHTLAIWCDACGVEPGDLLKVSHEMD